MVLVDFGGLVEEVDGLLVKFVRAIGMGDVGDEFS